jgi:arylsulfatase A-like enzyme
VSSRALFERAGLLWVLLLLNACGGGNDGGSEAPTPDERTNIILIIADDLGYADLGVQGSTDVLSPHIDSLAADGVRFTSGYVSSPVCSPTRAGLMTGRYQQQFGHELSPPSPPPAGFGLPLEEITFAEKLRAAGYATGLVGKWHLGSEAQFHPISRGFDEFFGFLGGSHSYVDWSANPIDPILRDFEPVIESTYLTEAFTREGVSFVQRHQDEPFFLCLSYSAVHRPLETPPQRYMDRFPDITDPKRQIFLAMLAAMDDGVGAALDAVRAAGVEQRTLVIFHSDNGGLTSLNTSLNTPLRGEKEQLWEGGIRVPFLVRWNGRLPAGLVYDWPVMQLDLFTTALAAAGVAPPDDRTIDGVNLIPYLDGTNPGEPHEALYWRSGSLSAARKGNWKIVKDGQNASQLFDLAGDIGETNDLAHSQPDVVSELEAELAAWQTELVPPLW